MGSWSTIGSVEYLLVEDGRERVPPRFLFADAPEPELEHALREHVDTDGLVEVPINCLLVRSAGRTALVDTGTGEFARFLGATAGGLHATLDEHGIAPDDIDVVVVTHAHPDHMGGLTRDGEPAITAASHVMAKAERLFWSAPETASRLPELMAEMPRMVDRTLGPLERSGQLARAAHDGMLVLASHVDRPRLPHARQRGDDGQRSVTSIVPTISSTNPSTCVDVIESPASPSTPARSR